MGGASSFYAMLAICGFLSAAWSATKISKLIGISSIVLEIAVGVALGPRVLGLINDEYAQCEHQRNADCLAPADLYDRIRDGLPLGETLGRIANMDYCDLHAYLEKEGRSGHTSGHGGGDGHGVPPGHGEGWPDPIHRNPCKDGTHAGLYTWSMTLGNGSLARYHCMNGTLVSTDLIHPDSSGDGHQSSSLQSSTDTMTTTQAASSTSPASVSRSGGSIGGSSSGTTVSRAAVTTPASTTRAPATSMGPVVATTAMPMTTPGVVAGTTQAAGAAQADLGISDVNASEANETEDNETYSDDSDLAGGLVASAPAPAESGARRLSGGGGGGAKYGTYRQCLEKSCEADVSHHCSLTPDVFTLIGHAGVALMIFESGMHFDFEKARQVGIPACIVAVIGTILPLATGSLLVLAFGKPFVPDGVAAGTALAPTSVGISLRLLGEAGVLQESFGQAIITAAFVDDILSLVLFNVLFSLGGDFDVVTTVVYPIVGIAFMAGAMVAAVKFWPTVIDERLLPMIPDERDDLATGLNRIRLTKDEVLFLVMIILLVLYALITHLLGTHLWGCFMAGMSFACLHPVGHAHHVWVKQTKRMTTWMVRIFFACTVAFSIPVADLMSLNAFLKGSLMGIGPCILTKVSCALFMGPPRFVIGWAMVGRAEFAYLIAQMAAAANMIDEETFSICIWALLYATIFAPFVFRYLLNNYIKQYGLGDKAADAEAAVEDSGDRHAEDKRAFKVNFEGNDERLRDLEDIDLRDANRDAPELEVMGNNSSGPESDAYEIPAKSILKPKGVERVRKGQVDKGGIWPGAEPKVNGFLCCLFFKRIIEH